MRTHTACGASADSGGLCSILTQKNSGSRRRWLTYDIRHKCHIFWIKLKGREMNIEACSIALVLGGFALIFIYLLIGAKDEFLSSSDTIDGFKTLPNSEIQKDLYDGKFAGVRCPCDICAHGLEHHCGSNT